MKMIKFQLMLFAVSALLFTSCVKDNSPIITETFDLDPFDAIALSIAGDVEITYGTDQFVEVTGPERTVGKIKKEVSEDGVWDINLPNGYNRNYEDLEIKITVPQMRELTLSGSGKITTVDEFEIESVTISGSGNIDALTNADTVESLISGSGNIEVAGTTNLLEHDTSGSGRFEGFGLETSNAVVTISGSGNAEVYVTFNLDVLISGSGNVYYKGDPSIDVEISGSGQLINAN